MKNRQEEEISDYEYRIDKLERDIVDLHVKLADKNWIKVEDLQRLKQQVREYRDQARMNKEERDKLDMLLSKKEQIY